MKKLFLIILCAFFLFSLSACNLSQKYESAEKIDSYGDQPDILKWEDVAYTEYHTVQIWAGERLPNDVKVSKQIAIVNGDKFESNKKSSDAGAKTTFFQET